MYSVSEYLDTVAWKKDKLMQLGGTEVMVHAINYEVLDQYDEEGKWDVCCTSLNRYL